MEIRTQQLGILQTNCYVAWGENAQSCVVVDPGDEPEQVIACLRQLGKTLSAILLTHGHFDHVGGVKPLTEAYGCPVYICREELSLPPSLTAGEIPYTHTYGEGDSLSLSGLDIRVLQTPGHTPGSVCLQCGDVLFTGDTLFAGTCGRTDLPGGSPLQIVQSLKRLACLEGDYRVLPGHGPESTLDEERRSNPFMV